MSISSFYFVQKSAKTYSYLSVFWIEQYGIWKGQSWGSRLQKSLVDIMIIKTILPAFLVQKQSCQGEEHPNFSLFPLCATVSSWIFPKAEKSLVLKVVSLYNNETFDSIRDEIFSWCYQLLFIWSIITKKSLQLSCFYFEVENGAMKIPYTIWLPYQVVWLAEYGKWRESCLLIGDTNGQYGYVKSCALQGLPAFNSAQKRPVAALNTL